MDEGDGLYFMRARYYDRDVGSFLTRDPVMGDIADTQRLGGYVYAKNNPIMHVDPRGPYAWGWLEDYGIWYQQNHKQFGMGLMQVGSGGLEMLYGGPTGFLLGAAEVVEGIANVADSIDPKDRYVEDPFVAAVGAATAALTKSEEKTEVAMELTRWIETLASLTNTAQSSVSNPTDEMNKFMKAARKAKGWKSWYYSVLGSGKYWEVTGQLMQLMALTESIGAAKDVYEVYERIRLSPKTYARFMALMNASGR